MSSSDFAITYTSISSEDVPFWGIRLFGMEQPDSLEAAPQSPIQTPPVPQDEDEREPMFIQPHDPDYVQEPIYPEYIPLKDEHVVSAEEQHYLLDDAEDEDEEDEEEEEEEHLALANSTVVVPTAEPVSLHEGTYRIIPPPSTNITTTRARITALIDAVTTALPSPPLPPPLYIPPHVDRMRSGRVLLLDRPEVEGWNMGLSDAEARRQRIIEVGYGIRDAWINPAEAVLEVAPMTSREVNTRVTKLDELHEHDTHDLYALLEDAQDRLSQAVHYEIQTHRKQVYETRFQMQHTEMTELRETNRRRQAHMVEILRVMRDMRREMVDMQAELLALREQQRRARQSGSDARVKGNDVPTYTERFQELTLICIEFVANETEKIDKYISGLSDNIYGSVKASKLTTLDETIELANDLMDQKLRTYAESQTDNKRKVDDSSRNNHGHQQHPSKRHNVAKKCHRCNKVGHLAHDCRSSGNVNVANAQRDNKAIPKGTGCFECGAPRH
nr:reverse transcriptase domain-containing protein [Tanacetum cinerariifolium]